MTVKAGVLVPWAGPGVEFGQCWLECGESAGGSAGDVGGAAVDGGNEGVHGEKKYDADAKGLTCSNWTHSGNYGAQKVFDVYGGSDDVKAFYAAAGAVAVVFDGH